MNSGEDILEMCSRNVDFHGAGAGGARAVVRDMARVRWERRWRVEGEMVAIGDLKCRNLWI